MGKPIDDLERTAGMPGGLLQVMQDHEARLSALEKRAAALEPLITELELAVLGKVPEIDRMAD